MKCTRDDDVTYNFGILSTFPQLLNSVGMLHIVHGDTVYHHHSIILSVDKKIYIFVKKNINALNTYLSSNF